MPYRHHAAGHRQLFEDRHLVALLGQVIGGREPGRTRADDGHLLRPRFSLTAGIAGCALADARSRPGTGAAPGWRAAGPRRCGCTSSRRGGGRRGRRHRGKGWSSRKRLEGLLVLARVDQGDVALDADVRRAGRLAGRRAALVRWRRRPACPGHSACRSPCAGRAPRRSRWTVSMGQTLVHSPQLVHLARST